MQKAQFITWQWWPLGFYIPASLPLPTVPLKDATESVPATPVENVDITVGFARAYTHVPPLPSTEILGSCPPTRLSFWGNGPISQAYHMAIDTQGMDSGVMQSASHQLLQIHSGSTSGVDTQSGRPEIEHSGRTDTHQCWEKLGRCQVRVNCTRTDATWFELLLSCTFSSHPSSYLYIFSSPYHVCDNSGSPMFRSCPMRSHLQLQSISSYTYMN